MKQKENKYWKITFLMVCVFMGLSSCMEKPQLEKLIDAKVKIEADAAGAVTVYQDCNYSGYGVTLGEGNYDAKALLAKGIQNNDLSSIQITRGYQVILYEHENFTGSTLIKTHNGFCLVSDQWNDRISSLKVTKANLISLYE